MDITNEDIKKLALLSRIEVTEQEVNALKKRLEAVLEYASGLKNIAKYGSGHMPVNYNIVRTDVVVPTDAGPLLAQAPDVQDHYFVVPKIVKSDN